MIIFLVFFFRNVSQFSNETITKKCFISDGKEVLGSFHHWGGTGSFREEVNGESRINTERLSNIADKNTSFIKLDTDGYDFKILIDNLDWLAEVRPAILFENQIQNSRDLSDSNELLTQLIQIGYRYFVVWDDPGFHLVSTTSLDVLLDMNRYLYKVWQNNKHQSIYNYDVLCLHQTDEDIYKDICAWYKSY